MQKQYIRTYLNNKLLAYVTAAACLFCAMLMGISIGTVSIHPMTIIRVISAEIFPFISLGNTDAMHANIIMNIRLPRVLLAGLVGASLAIAGAAFQGLLRNPLADPYTIGVSSGASLGAVLTLFFGLSIPFAGMFTLPLFSILFSFLTIFAVLLFARNIERSMKVETIILTGIIFSSFLGALISLMIALTGEELRQIIGWLLGSVSMRGWAYINIILPFFIIGAILLLVNSKELNAMSFGEEKAQHIGVDVQKRKMMVLVAGSILTGAAVAVSGTIGFVGLVIPHLTRMLWGPDHRHLLPLSILMGSGFLIIADLVSRTIIAPAELPIGVITALIGAPAFGVILMKRKNKL
ncbi:FecCD family ABC transporter permease [Cytobacillus firmus]|uniref:FecCD family ABC transporter permease n=1 Tax=Cytobacillus firmus TaxID=1399 RepID=UPI00077CCEAD|nr:iron ABC transporter permease [Cytobacillus firmus]MBG9544484.1 corrinoid ABC transporter permease [Cytobacillus firmus]MBG9549334.1 corrinoid ABC transporter permease [Cytobacillus firmus]MBG9551913.1 corrinoid ABC transporter permease [Cytobacillus firmus]MBG9555223.1 corrinoid ABC transporter permease [Cytobacillus firmus]MBG9573505.1 corrinoid ABC transporter permease [Cytobacillus firmus]